METIPRRRPVVVTAAEEVAINLPEHVTIALRDLAGAVKHGLLALSVSAGLAVVGELFEDEVIQLVGPRGKHDPGRQAYRMAMNPDNSLLVVAASKSASRGPGPRTTRNSSCSPSTSSPAATS